MSDIFSLSTDSIQRVFQIFLLEFVHFKVVKQEKPLKLMNINSEFTLFQLVSAIVKHNYNEWI